jgi:hypothetical protein
LKNKKVFFVSVALGLSIGAAAVSTAAVVYQSKGDTFTFSKGVQPRLEDNGSPSEIASLKQRSKTLIESGNLMSNTKPSVQKAIGDDPDSPAGRKLKSDLEKVWVPQKAEENFNEIVSMFQMENGMALDQTFEKGEFVVQEWQGVQVDGSQAEVRVIGHWESRKGSQLTQDALTQWTLTLEKETQGGRWLMVDRVGVVLEGR